MALKAKDQIKTVIGAADLQLRADPGESFLITGINVKAASASYVTLKTEKTTVGYFRVDAAYSNHLAFPQVRDTAQALAPHYPKNLLTLLGELGIFKGFPIAEGETFVLSGAGAATDIKSVAYEIYDGEDMKNTDPNGSKSNEYTFIGYGDTGTTIETPGDNLYDTPLTPVEFPAFPFAKDVPARHQITIHGILGTESAVVNATPALAIYTQYLKLVKDREVLFDEDRNGLPFSLADCTLTAGQKAGGGKSVIGNFSHIDPRPPYLLAAPLLFEGGDELNIYATAVEPVDGSSITRGNHIIGIIMTVKRVAAT